MKYQIIIRLFGIGWDDWHHPWYAAGHQFAGEELTEHIKNLMKRGNKIQISDKLPVDILTRNKLEVLGTISPDIIILDTKKAAEEGNLFEATEVLKK